ncbi:germ cell nuclear acidic protein-like [Ranitomeya variabilis]|uniref:germ cell nuclear acidic protein-like n=1 Tax=Ranitomeya variabilis TaxID=490064 RepID=UPI004057C588
MMRKKRFKRIIVLSDTEDSSDDDDLHQSHPRKRPIPRSPGQDNISGFNSGPTPSLPDLVVPPSEHGPDSSTCSDAIILIDDDDSNRAGTSMHNNLILPTSDDPDSSTCSDAISNTDDDESNTGGTSSYNNNIPSDSEESSATEERTPLCKIPGCFLEDIISPTSIYVTNFQETKEELVDRLYNLYNRTVFSNKLPAKMEISWSKRLTSASGQCCHKLDNDRRYSVIELSEKVCDSAVRVRSTLAHELCHAACWICLAEGRDNHGPLWQEVTRIVNRNHPELPKVTENHSYTIHYKYNYKCSLCDNEIGRFRKIPDNKCYCRRCGGRLHQLSVS